MRKIHGKVCQEDSDYVAQCLGFDISSGGETQEEALSEAQGSMRTLP
ncbi:MAG: hypothetical protein V4640_16420 [Verrucomicrobiota bacterium]